MYYLFFDTETTGKPKDYKRPMTDVDNWPRLVQLGYLWMRDDGKVIDENEFIIRPDGFFIPEEVSRIHGITTEKALLNGVLIENVIDHMRGMFTMCDVVVGHNVSFDINVLGAEFVRQGRENPFEGKAIIDTMTAATNYCQIPGAYGYKWPKLTELWRKLFGTELPQTHTALDDIKHTADCYFALVERGVIKVPA